VDLIEIEGLHLRCVIGCTAEERRDRSDVVIDLTVGTEAASAGASDDLADAWDYRTAAKAVIAAVEASECFTVEALATRIARCPVAGEFLDHRQLRALRMILDELLVGPAGGRDARTQRFQFRLGGDRDRERPDRCGAG
jgi:FolB domain-containing protein